MADEFYSHEHLCLVWKIKDNLASVLRSPKKNFGNGELALEFDPVTDPSKIVLKINSESSYTREYSVRTFLVDRNEENNQKEVQESNMPEDGTGEIWSISSTEFDSLKKTLKDNGLTFVCTINFQDIYEEHELTDSTEDSTSGHRRRSLNPVPHHNSSVPVSMKHSKASSALPHTESQTIVQQREFERFSHFDVLSQDFKKLLGNRKNSDVVLVCEGQNIYAHKAILSARSEVFNAIFNDRTRSRLRCEATEITNIQLSTLYQMLQYIYTGESVGLSVGKAILLYEAASEYMIYSLVERCKCITIDNVTANNVCQILLLADKYKDTQLRYRAISFIMEKEGFFRARNWIQFCQHHPLIAVKVCKDILRCYSSVSPLYDGIIFGTETQRED